MSLVAVASLLALVGAELPAIKFIGIRMGFLEDEVTEYRDLEVEAEDGESHREVQLSREDQEA